ncbi:tripartite tricarboxylate transporter substrate binding protein [Comamonadaceae bacterium G21597-S1]|nr:tripartite tricarboxylate transporter substrate binding protein [Comamonadaceae bacterium G21597-S1]
MTAFDNRIERRRMLAMLALLPLGATPWARAQAYPSKPVRFIVSFPPGSGADTTARLYARRLQEITKQSFIVENRTGGNSFIAAQAVATAAPDGSTLFFASNSPVVVNAVLFKSLPYNPLNDFAAVARTSRGTNLLLVPQNSPYKTVAELVDAAKKAPKKLNYASGSASYQIATEEFAEAVGAEFTHVPYKGSAPAIQDTAAGQTDFTIADISASLPLVQSGRLRALAVTSDRRHGALPNVPTAIESGAKDFEFYNWTGVFAPATTPQPVLDKLTQLIEQITAEPETVAFLSKIGGEIFPGDAKELRAYQVAQIEQWKRVARRAGIEPQ